MPAYIDTAPPDHVAQVRSLLARHDSLVPAVETAISGIAGDPEYPRYKRVHEASQRQWQAGVGFAAKGESLAVFLHGLGLMNTACNRWERLINDIQGGRPSQDPFAGPPITEGPARSSDVLNYTGLAQPEKQPAASTPVLLLLIIGLAALILWS